MTIILPLANLRRSDIPLGGGKAANLGELIAAGLNVPPGFILTTAAYSHFVHAAELHKPIQTWLTTLDPLAGSQLRQAFVNQPMPTDLSHSIVSAYQQLGSNIAVAVRSSATAEDLPGATFAGQQETYLNVCDEAELLLAVRNCWASLWTERATLYRSKQQVDQHSVKLAVVVQRMVMAEVAGVLFTANPVTGERNLAVIDASPGLGEAVVSGMVTPDHFLIDKATQRIQQRRLGSREVEIRPRATGGIEEIRNESGVGEPSLNDRQLGELTRLGNHIEQHYGAPQDIEWAWAEGQFYILQARPITALPAAAVTPQASASPRKSRPGPDPAELFPIRPYPLDCDTHTNHLQHNVASSLGGPLGVSFPTLEEFLEIEDGVVVRGGEVRLRPSWRMLYKPFLSLWQSRAIDLRQWASDPIIHEAKARARRLENQVVAQLSWQQLLQTMQDALELERFICQLRRRYFIVAIRDVALLGLWLGLVGQRKELQTLITGLSNISLEINQALASLAEQIRQQPTLKRAFVEQNTATLLRRLQDGSDENSAEWRALQSAFASLLAEFGSREMVITLMSQPTWKDAPEVPLAILKNLVSSTVASSSPAKSAETNREVRLDKLLATTILGKAPLRNQFLKRLEKARHFIPMRENTHYYLSLPMPIERRVALEMGRRLTQLGVLEQAEEVFHLRYAELQSIQEPAHLTAEQQRSLTNNMARRKQRRAELSDQPLFVTAQEDPQTVDPTALLNGVGGSPGVVEGTVRLIMQPQEFDQLQEGEILVAPYTNPAWTPLFLRATAAIVDTGSAMSHAAIVTREYGIPAVLGVRNATRLLKTGQRVRVDGTKGTVHAA